MGRSENLRKILQKNRQKERDYMPIFGKNVAQPIGATIYEKFKGLIKQKVVEDCPLSSVVEGKKKLNFLNGIVAA